MKKYDKYFDEVLFSEKEIKDKISELAIEVDKEYAESKDLIIVGLLKGCVPFMAQLINQIETNHIIDFITVSSFDGAMNSSGNIKIVMDLKHDITGKDILIVEDIVDSGRTLTKVVSMFNDRNPKSIKVITLLDKPEGRVVEYNVWKSGFIVKNMFLAGFGLDVKGKLRNVPYIGVFNKDTFEEL